MFQYIKCGCDGCDYYEDGNCVAQYVDIEMTMTPSGFYPICNSYKEKEVLEDE